MAISWLGRIEEGVRRQVRLGENSLVLKLGLLKN